MEIRVDGERLLAPMTGGTLADALDMASSSIFARARGVSRVRVNGNSVNFEEVTDAFLATPVSDLTSVELDSELMVTLARRDLDDLDSVMLNLPSFCHSLAELFHDAASADGLNYFVDLQQAWGEINDRQNAAAEALGIALSSVEMEEGSARDHRNKVIELVTKAHQAVLKNDRVTVSDLLEYDLAPLAEEETVITAVLNARLRDAEAAAGVTPGEETSE